MEYARLIIVGWHSDQRWATSGSGAGHLWDSPFEAKNKSCRKYIYSRATINKKKQVLIKLPPLFEPRYNLKGLYLKNFQKFEYVSLYELYPFFLLSLQSGGSFISTCFFFIYGGATVYIFTTALIFGPEGAISEVTSPTATSGPSLITMPPNHN